MEVITMKKLLLTGLVALSSFFAQAGLTPEQMQQVAQVQKKFLNECADLKKEYKAVFDGTIADEKFDNGIYKVIMGIGYSYLEKCRSINSIILGKEYHNNITLALANLYENAFCVHFRLLNLSTVWMSPEAQAYFDKTMSNKIDSMTDAELLSGAVISEFVTGLKNAGVDSKDQYSDLIGSGIVISEKQLRKAVGQVVEVAMNGLHSSVASSIASKAGRKDTTKQDEIKALNLVSNNFENLITMIPLTTSEYKEKKIQKTM